MTELQTVFAAVDHSDSALPTVRLAKLFAGFEDGARLFVGHAVPPIPPPLSDVLFPYACLGDDLDALRAELVEHAHRRLVKRLQGELGDDTAETVRVDAGNDVVDTLLGLTARLGPDLAVIGSIGEGQGRQLGLGSIARAFTARQPTAVLVAHRTANSVDMRRIVAAVDLGVSSQAVLKSALTVAYRTGARVKPLAIIPTVEVQDHAQLWKDPSNVPGRLRKDAEQLIERHLDTLELPFPTDSKREDLLAPYHIGTGDPADEIVGLAESGDAELIVLGASRSVKGSGLMLGRTAERVLRLAPCHVLVVPPPEPGSGP